MVFEIWARSVAAEDDLGVSVVDGKSQYVQNPLPNNLDFLTCDLLREIVLDLVKEDNQNDLRYCKAIVL